MKEFLTKSVFAPPSKPPETMQQSTLRISLPAPNPAYMARMLHRGESLPARGHEKQPEDTHSLTSLDESSIVMVKDESDSFTSNPLGDLESVSPLKVPPMMPASARPIKPKRKNRSRPRRKAKSNAAKENFDPNVLRSSLSQIQRQQREVAQPPYIRD